MSGRWTESAAVLLLRRKSDAHEPMRREDAVRALNAAGFFPYGGKGSHEKWNAPDRLRHVVLTVGKETPSYQVREVAAEVFAWAAREPKAPEAGPVAASGDGPGVRPVEAAARQLAPDTRIEAIEAKIGDMEVSLAALIEAKFVALAASLAERKVPPPEPEPRASNGRAGQHSQATSPAVSPAASVVAGFGAPSAARVFLPAALPVRVSLVWWRAAPAGDPLFVPHADGSRSTLVATWPCDRRGSVIADRAAEVAVAEWRLAPAELAQLAELHREWPLHAYDVVVAIARGRLSVAPRVSNLFVAALARPSSPLAARVVGLVSAEVGHLAAELRSTQ